jgi:sodium-independent sulfate anion transporter 11
MASAGRNVAKVLGINLDYRKEELDNSGAASISSVETCMPFPAKPPSFS